MIRGSWAIMLSPAKNELFTSWLMRSAFAHGLTPIGLLITGLHLFLSGAVTLIVVPVMSCSIPCRATQVLMLRQSKG